MVWVTKAVGRFSSSSMSHVVGRADQPGAGNGAEGALDLIVPSMADKDQLAAGSGETAGLVVDLAHQGTGRIDRGHLPAPRLFVDAGADAVGREHDAGPSGTCASSSTKMAPADSRRETTWALCTIWRRTYTGGP